MTDSKIDGFRLGIYVFEDAERGGDPRRDHRGVRGGGDPGQGGADAIEGVVRLEEEVPADPHPASRRPATSTSAATSLPPGGLYSPCMAG